MASILIVDDEPDVRYLLRSILAGAGHRVTEAPHGNAALEQIARERPDVVLTDLMMPMMDGRVLVEQLRGDPSTRSLLIVLVSASAQQVVGVDAVLRKPFTPTDVVRAIADLVGEGG